jgi:serine phosphatase RsbU (regulator of sigma subunit)
MQGGFTTCLVLRLDPDGTVTFANAGHLPPFLNQREIMLEGSLPLGLVSSAYYGEVAMQAASRRLPQPLYRRPARSAQRRRRTVRL